MYKRPLLQITRHQENIHHHRHSDQPLHHNFYLPTLPVHIGIYASQFPQLGQPYACANSDMHLHVKGNQETQLLLEHSHLLLGIRTPINLSLPVRLLVWHK